MSPRLTIRRVRRVRLVTRPQFVTRSALTDARVSALRSCTAGGAPESSQARRERPPARAERRSRAGVVSRRADER